MGSSAELRRSVREFILSHVTTRFKEFDEARRAHPSQNWRGSKPRIHLHWLTDIISNFMLSRPLGEAPYTSQPARDEFLRLKRANRLRLVQSRLDRLVDEGVLVFFVAPIVLINSMGYPQKFREKCYRPPTSLLEVLAFVSR